MTDHRPMEDPTRTAPPEPSTKSQVDIANDVQDGLRESKDKAKGRGPTVGGKATQFDGNPNPERDGEGGVFSPPDDTPSVLPKKEGT
ncbi:hypothetical protein [Bordetella genomosp. 11]|uniref:Uncharacterized protein n=1 Tax=Bordetella genomosp. 11 TaxID=1416808 RepID=A0A261UZ44_9BORD|nr:hypothetical protein [Bordetella genomosp. 11]OZI66871.1 hypothetical protein CAL28_03890 [Bordetella genomosp. 11]